MFTLPEMRLKRNYLCLFSEKRTGMINGIGIRLALIGPKVIIKRYIQSQGEESSAGIVRQKMSSY